MSFFLLNACIFSCAPLAASRSAYPCCIYGLKNLRLVRVLSLEATFLSHFLLPAQVDIPIYLPWLLKLIILVIYDVISLCFTPIFSSKASVPAIYFFSFRSSFLQSNSFSIYFFFSYIQSRIFFIQHALPVSFSYSLLLFLS